MRRLVRSLGLWWVDRRIRSGLDGVELSGEGSLLRASAAGPVVVACTHQAWWDGPVAVWVCERLGLSPTLPVSARGMAQHPYFAAFGAVEVRGPAGVRRLLGSLQAPGDVLWIFPQGEHQPPDRPMRLQAGAAWLAVRAGCPLIPAVLSYPFGERPVPGARLVFGEPVERTDAALLAALEGLRGAAGPTTALVPRQAEPAGLASRTLAALWRWTCAR